MHFIGFRGSQMNIHARSRQLSAQDCALRGSSVRILAQPDNPRFGLVCFPCAGASASFYSNWRKLFGGNEVLAAIQLPGREDRLAEAFAENLHEAANEIASDLQLHFPGLPLVFFGHSFGALVAYHASLAMQHAGHGGPVHFFASARIAPNQIIDHGLSAAFDDESLVAELRSIGFEHENLLIHPGFLRLFLPVLRADLLLNDGDTGSAEKLSCPLTAFSGSHDELAPSHMVAGWKELTSGPFDQHVFSGGHFYLRPHFQDLCASMRAIINFSLQPSQSKARKAIA